MRFSSPSFRVINPGTAFSGSPLKRPRFIPTRQANTSGTDQAVEALGRVCFAGRDGIFTQGFSFGQSFAWQFCF